MPSLGDLWLCARRAVFEITVFWSISCVDGMIDVSFGISISPVTLSTDSSETLKVGRSRCSSIPLLLFYQVQAILDTPFICVLAYHRLISLTTGPHSGHLLFKTDIKEQRLQ